MGRPFQDKLSSNPAIYLMISEEQVVFTFNAREGVDFNVPSAVRRQLDNNELFKSFVV